MTPKARREYSTRLYGRLSAHVRRPVGDGKGRPDGDVRQGGAEMTGPRGGATAVPVRLVVDDELARATAHRLVGAVEWVLPIFQAAVLLTSFVVDPYRPGGRVIVALLVAMHLVLAPIYARGNGPFSRGGRWLAAPAVQCLAVNGLVAGLAVSGTFGTNLASLPAGVYSNAMWVLLALYPWLPPRLSRQKVAIELALIGIYVCYLLLLTRLASGHFGLRTAACVGGVVPWILVAYALGRAGGMMCLRAARAQVDVQQRSFQEFFDFLHSHVKANVAAVRAEMPVNAHGARQKLAELENTVSRYRVELLLAQERTPLAALFSERIRAFAGTLHIDRTPRVGGMTVTRPIGTLVSRALGDLLKNAAVHGAGAVTIDLEQSAGWATLIVADDGPGFPASVLDNEGCSLFRLRKTARDLGGDLRQACADGAGSQLTLTVPLAPRR